jgi:hypothetical protein
MHFTDSSNKKLYKLANLILAETQTTQLEADNAPCGSYAAQGFIECCKTKFKAYFEPRINCTIFSLKFFSPYDLKWPLCTTKQEAAATFNEFTSSIELFIDSRGSFGCPVPCRTTRDRFYKTAIRRKTFWIKFFIL